MAKRRLNPRLAKSLLCYSIAQTADLYGVHRQTVRHWLANGLQPIDERRPILIHGNALNRFHAERRAASKTCCAIGEVFCLACRAPRVPAANIADFVPTSGNAGTLTAICPVCEQVMTQRVNTRRLALFRTMIAVTDRPGPEPIAESR